MWYKLKGCFSISFFSLTSLLFSPYLLLLSSSLPLLSFSPFLFLPSHPFSFLPSAFPPSFFLLHFYFCISDFFDLWQWPWITLYNKKYMNLSHVSHWSFFKITVELKHPEGYKRFTARISHYHCFTVCFFFWSKFSIEGNMIKHIYLLVIMFMFIMYIICWLCILCLLCLFVCVHSHLMNLIFISTNPNRWFDW